MKSFFAILITFVLMTSAALAIDPPTPPDPLIPTNGTEASGQEHAELGAFLICTPSLTMVNDKYIHNLGNFFVNGVQREYEITPDGAGIGDEYHWLAWRLEGPVEAAVDATADPIVMVPIKYQVQQTAPANADDDGVVLEVRWRTFAANKTTAKSGYLSYLGDNGVILNAPTDDSNCGGWAEFRIVAIKLTVPAAVSSLGMKVFQMTVIVDASI